MNLWKIAWRNLQHRALASTLTTLSMALGVALVIAVLVMHSVISDSFRSSSRLGYNLVVGPRGGRLDLVLNTVYYLSRPIGALPWSYYLEFSEGKYKPYVETAVPVCLGDYFQEYRVVATTPDMFGKFNMQERPITFAAGSNFRGDEYFTAVIGATVSRTAGVGVGDEIQPTHGVPDGHAHDPFKVVGVLAPTGTPVDRAVFVNIEGFYLINDHARPVDEPTTAAAQRNAHKEHDHAVEIGGREHKEGEDGHAHGDSPSDGQEPAAGAGEDEHDPADDSADGANHNHESANVSDKEKEDADHDRDHLHHDHDPHGHKHSHSHEPLPIAQREVSAILVLNATIPGSVPEALAPAMALAVDREGVAMVVFPTREIIQLFDSVIGPVRWLLVGLTLLIVVVAGVGMLVSIYNSMAERRHEIAVMRALGAGRGTVMRLILIESLLLAVLAGAGGWLIGHGLTAALSPWINQQTGVSLGFFQPGWFSVSMREGQALALPDFAILPVLVIPAILAGYLPALLAYRTDVAKALQSTP